MTEQNPYASPKTDTLYEPSVTDTSERTRRIASGQKLIIYAILLSLAGFALAAKLGLFAGLIAIASFAMSVFGLVRLTTAMEIGVGLRILLLMLMFVPLVSLIVLLVLNSRATKILRAAGYRVGLLGASLPNRP
jgi:hypothetical protein